MCALFVFKNRIRISVPYVLQETKNHVMTAYYLRLYCCEAAEYFNTDHYIALLI